MSLLKYRDYGRLWRVYGRALLQYGTPKKVLNALRTELAYRRRTVDVRSSPYILFLEPLYYCNLDCPLCDRQLFPDARKNDAGRLTLELYEKILDEVGDYLFQCQIFGQGEPLLDWPLSKAIIERSHARRIFTLMSTNTILATPERAAEIVSCGLDHLVCAIDGISQESYAVYRVKGKVDEAIAGMRRIADERRKQKSKTHIEWQFLVHRHNVHEIDAARAMAKEIGVEIRFAPLNGMEWDSELETFWLADGVDHDAAAKKLTAGEPWYDWPCYFLWRSLVLNSNGKVARCLLYQNVAEYVDLHDVSVMDAYNHPTVRRARELFSKGPVAEGEFPSPCNNCSYYTRHHGGAYEGKREAAVVRRRSLPVLAAATAASPDTAYT